MGCECKATIKEDDPRAEIWMYVFGSRSFPLRHPFLQRMKGALTKGYVGEGSALTDEQRERLIERMMAKFNLSHAEMVEGLKDNVIPIKPDGVVVSICSMHFWNMVL